MTAGQVGSPPPRPRAWPVIRWILRGLLAAALVALVALIVVRQTGSTPLAAPETTPATTAAAGPTPSATPKATPTPTPTPTATTPADPGTGGGGTGGGEAPQPPANPAPVITSFGGTNAVICPTPSEAPAPGAGQVEPPTVSLSWTGTGADSAFFGIGTKDAQAEPFSSVGVNDSIAVDFQCPQASQIYTITLVGPGGATSRTVTISNDGYKG
ncbi:hypothetical protein [Herbiconiux ginsengi]|uniref:Uncharacterized protein n=1 Tax=Herbiconiux ginsengi TaxID=381665 RepID=A0A1H3KQ70_9MICO|nr:hypothetical protein [Herbiconiux ginsengi]SDY54210.1 hypothetical protein SAMN05216554_0648 [Herbiconiux ginsengi]